MTMLKTKIKYVSNLKKKIVPALMTRSKSIGKQLTVIVDPNFHWKSQAVKEKSQRDVPI